MAFASPGIPSSYAPLLLVALVFILSPDSYFWSALHFIQDVVRTVRPMLWQVLDVLREGALVSYVALFWIVTICTGLVYFHRVEKRPDTERRGRKLKKVKGRRSRVGRGAKHGGGHAHASYSSRSRPEQCSDAITTHGPESCTSSPTDHDASDGDSSSDSDIGDGITELAKIQHQSQSVLQPRMGARQKQKLRSSSVFNNIDSAISRARGRRSRRVTGDGSPPSVTPIIHGSTNSPQASVSQTTASSSTPKSPVSSSPLPSHPCASPEQVVSRPVRAVHEGHKQKLESTVVRRCVSPAPCLRNDVANVAVPTPSPATARMPPPPPIRVPSPESTSAPAALTCPTHTDVRQSPLKLHVELPAGSPIKPAARSAPRQKAVTPPLPSPATAPPSVLPPRQHHHQPQFQQQQQQQLTFEQLTEQHAQHMQGIHHQQQQQQQQQRQQPDHQVRYHSSMGQQQRVGGQTWSVSSAGSRTPPLPLQGGGGGEQGQQSRRQSVHERGDQGYRRPPPPPGFLLNETASSGVSGGINTPPGILAAGTTTPAVSTVPLTGGGGRGGGGAWPALPTNLLALPSQRGVQDDNDLLESEMFAVANQMSLNVLGFD